MTKENFDIETVEVKPYRAQQSKSFQFLGTESSMWEMCDITGVQENYVMCDIPKGYRKVDPYYEQFPDTTTMLAYNCQLCGHDILYLFPIKCEKKKIYMMVGSECVNNFKGAEYVTKEIKRFKETETRKKIENCINDLITQCNNHKDGSWLNEPYYSFKKKLVKVRDNASEFSHRKLVNILKKAKGIGLDTDRTKKQINKERKDKEREQKKIDKEYEDKLKAIQDPLKAIGLMPLVLPFTGKYFKICNIPKDDFDIRYTLNHSEIETVKKLGGFYWDHVEGWVVPAPIKGVIT